MRFSGLKLVLAGFVGANIVGAAIYTYVKHAAHESAKAAVEREQARVALEVAARFREKALQAMEKADNVTALRLITEALQMAPHDSELARIHQIIKDNIAVAENTPPPSSGDHTVTNAMTDSDADDEEDDAEVVHPTRLGTPAKKKTKPERPKKTHLSAKEDQPAPAPVVVETPPPPPHPEPEPQPVREVIHEPTPPPPAPEVEPAPTPTYEPRALYLVFSANLSASALTTQAIQDIYEGRASSVNGASVQPILRPLTHSATGAFISRVLGETAQQYRNDWQRATFAGEGPPPRAILKASDLVNYVRSRSGIIGYCYGSELEGLGQVNTKKL